MILVVGGLIFKEFHRKPPAALLHIANEGKALLLHRQRHLHQSKLSVGGDEATRMMPRLRQLKEHLRPLPGFVGSSDVVIVGDGISGGGDGDCHHLVGALDHFQMEHDTRCGVGKIMNLATVVGLALEGKVHRQACVHEGTPFAIPSDNCLLGLEMAAGDKCPLGVLVDVVDKIVDQHPTIPL